jgi:hypothetical protein
VHASYVVRQSQCVLWVKNCLCISNSVHKECVCLSLYIEAVAGRAGQFGLCGTYAAVVAVDIVTNTVTNIVEKIG